MNQYDPGTPRALFGLAAIAMTAATLAVAVIAPAAMDYGTREIGVLTQANQVTTVSAIDASTASIDVVAVRGMRLVPAVHSHAPAAKRGLQG
jgi:hypothetical protein